MRIEPRQSGFDEFDEPSPVWVAIAPLYPKIRISAYDLFLVAEDVMPTIRRLVDPPRRDQIALLARFVPNGDYRSEAWSLGLEPRRAYALAAGLLLSRYVGVLRFMVGDAWIADVLCDVTDLNRRDPKWGSVVALVAADTAPLAPVASDLRELCPHIRVL